MNNTNSVLIKTRFLYPTLPKAEKKFANYFLDNPERIATMTLLEVSEDSFCSDSAIIRFSKRIGFSGFTEFKQCIALYHGGETGEKIKDIVASDSMQEIVRKVFQHNMQTLSETLGLLSEEYTLALNALICANSIHFFGVGDAYIVGELAHTKFTRIGKKGSAYNDVVMQLTIASTLKKGDVAFAISHSGRTRNTVDALRLAKEGGATTICITKMDKSLLVKYADIKLYTATTDLTIGDEIIARRVAEQAIMEALYSGVVTKSGEDFSQTIEKTRSTFELIKK